LTNEGKVDKVKKLCSIMKCVNPSTHLDLRILFLQRRTVIIAINFKGRLLKYILGGAIWDCLCYLQIQDSAEEFLRQERKQIFTEISIPQSTSLELPFLELTALEE